jgi:hypothetical protein
MEFREFEEIRDTEVAGRHIKGTEVAVGKPFKLGKGFK